MALDTNRKEEVHSLETLWKLRQRVNQGPRASLSLERVVAAAIALVDEEGLGHLSMAKVAQRLDASTMGLYRHVKSKDELQLLMLDVAYGTPPDFDYAGSDWRAGLEMWAEAFLEVFRQHPWMLKVFVSRPPLEPGQLSWLEAGLRSLDDTRLTPDEKLSVMLLVIGYVKSNPQIAAAEGSPPGAEGAESYGATLGKLIDRDAFPALTELVNAGTFERNVDDFAFGLQRILDGVEVYMRQD